MLHFLFYPVRFRMVGTALDHYGAAWHLSGGRSSGRRHTCDIPFGRDHRWKEVSEGHGASAGKEQILAANRKNECVFLLSECINRRKKAVQMQPVLKGARRGSDTVGILQRELREDTVEDREGHIL